MYDYEIDEFWQIIHFLQNTFTNYVTADRPVS